MAVRQLSRICQGNEIIVTHGNGPQVGMLALESANDPALDHPFPLDVLGAQTQGMIGYWLVQALDNVLECPVVALLTQTVVDAKDPAFDTPTKFVGRGYSKEEAASGGRRKVDAPRRRPTLAPRRSFARAIESSRSRS